MNFYQIFFIISLCGEEGSLWYAAKPSEQKNSAKKDKTEANYFWIWDKLYNFTFWLLKKIKYKNLAFWKHCGKKYRN